MWPFSRKRTPSTHTPAAANPFENWREPTAAPTDSPMVIGLAQAKVLALYFGPCLPFIFEPDEALSQDQGPGPAVTGLELLEALPLPGLWQAIGSSMRLMREWAIVDETIRYWKEWHATGTFSHEEDQGIRSTAAHWMINADVAPMRAIRYLLGMIGQVNNPMLLSESLVAAGVVGDLRVTLRDVELVDCTQVGWRQIFEIRKDQRAARALREAFPIVFAEGMAKRTDMEARFRSAWLEHHEACAQFGLPRRVAQISILCGWASPMAAAAAANIALLNGGAVPHDLRWFADHQAQVDGMTVSMVPHHIMDQSRDFAYYVVDFRGPARASGVA